MWAIEEGILYLYLEDGLKYRPSAKEIYAQKDMSHFEYKEVMYPPLNATGLRFSGLVAHPKVFLQINETSVKIRLVEVKNDKEVEIGCDNGVFVDYVIYNNVWKYVDSVSESLNEILISKNINPNFATYAQYVVFIRELIDSGIPYIDNVVNSVTELRCATSLDKPKGLIADLFPYQSGGSKWLDFMVEHGCGCILGDEMGLGKTLQVITVMGLLKERKHDSHFLVICPVSLLENWRREILKFYPSITAHIHYGANRTGDYRDLLKYDVIIMAYSTAVSDSGMLTMLTWDLLIIDEAQNIKNPRAKRTRAIKQIKRNVPIAVTGTPFENHMTDIWSLVDFVLPGFLGNLNQFEAVYSDDVLSAIKLEKLITPIMLRRRVLEVAKDLPERIDIPQPIVMTEKEALLYEDCRQSDSLFEGLKDMQLAKIQKLRTFCTHPCVYNPSLTEVDPQTISNKYERLCEILSEIFINGEKAVVFTSFRRMIETLSNDVAKRFNVYTNFIDGSVEASERQEIVDEFSNYEGAGVLILNPKAAGAGLNITCANHVIHYNLEWNPAVEDQASARVYRRGQNKTVFVYRLFYIDTIEEIINEKIQQKRMLSDNAIIGNDGGITEKEYLLKALSASPFKS